MRNGIKEFHLVAEPVIREIAPGMKAHLWGYNGQSPGPTIEVVEGDRVRIFVTNRLPEAEPLMRRALAIDETAFGADHPNVASCLINLAGLLRDTNRLGEAEPLFSRVVQIRIEFQSRTGYEHPGLLDNLAKYRDLLQAMRKTPEQIDQQLHDLDESLRSEGS